MRKLIKTVFILGILFWGSFLGYAIGKMIVFNGLGNYYEFSCEPAYDFQFLDDTRFYKISYSYNDKGNIYRKTEEVSKELFSDQLGGIPEKLRICYNLTFPTQSYIENINLGIIQARNGIIISSFFIAFISVIYLLARKSVA